MKNNSFNKKLLTILTVSILTFSTIVNVQAKTISQKVTNIDRIAEMQAKVNSTHPGGEVINTEKYIEFTKSNDINGDIKIQRKEFNKAGYLEQIKSEAISNAAILTTNSILTNNSTTPGPVTSWLKTSLDVTSYGPTATFIDVTGYFQWLKAPFYAMTDVIAITHDSNSGIPNGSQHLSVVFPRETVGGDIASPLYMDKSYTSSDYINNTTAGGAFKFSLENSKASLNYGPYGYMTVMAAKAQTTTSATTVCFTYGHSQNGVNIVPAIRFPGGAVITITPVDKIDAVSMSTFAYYK